MRIRTPTGPGASPHPISITTAVDPTTVDAGRMTRAQRAALPLSTEVAQALARQHGVCIRPLAMRRIDTTTGRIDIVPVPCGSTRADQCPPCAEKARRLRMAQCRQGWHLEQEPITERAKPSEEHKELMATRADLLAAYTECKTLGDEITCEQIADSISELDTALRATGVRGRLTPSIPHPNPSSAPPAATTPRTYPAARSRNAPWGGCSPGATDPPPSSPSPWIPTAAWMATGPRWTPTATTTSERRGTRSTSRPW